MRGDEGPQIAIDAVLLGHDQAVVATDIDEQFGA